MVADEIKCQYCGGLFNKSLDMCPHCGATKEMEMAPMGSVSEPLYIFEFKNRALITLWVFTIIMVGLLGILAYIIMTTRTWDISDLPQIVIAVFFTAVLAFATFNGTLNRRSKRLEFYDSFVKLFPKWQKEGFEAKYSDVNITWKVNRQGRAIGTLTLKNDPAEKPQKWILIDMNGKITGKPLSLWLQSKQENL
jgi:hypothetical protein